MTSLSIFSGETETHSHRHRCPSFHFSRRNLAQRRAAGLTRFQPDAVSPRTRARDGNRLHTRVLCPIVLARRTHKFTTVKKRYCVFSRFVRLSECPGTVAALLFIINVHTWRHVHTHARTIDRISRLLTPIVLVKVGQSAREQTGSCVRGLCVRRGKRERKKESSAIVCTHHVKRLLL